MTLPKKVKIVEVGPRDGLQNEKASIETSTKIELINRLADTGLTVIEATSFVSPEWVPQMADNHQVMAGIQRKPGLHFPVLVPNIHGLDDAINAGVTEIGLFTAASEEFCQKNINCSIDESLERFSDVIKKAKAHNMWIRGYISCVMGCPYQGEVKPEAVAKVADKLIHLGCDEISLGDTIGVGNPRATTNLLNAVTAHVDPQKLAIHFHDTYGQALANIYTALQCGINIIDTSVAGLGGCPYAKGASGNVATEDVVYLLQGLDIDCDVDLAKLVNVSDFICKALNRPNGSKVAVAMLG